MAANPDFKKKYDYKPLEARPEDIPVQEPASGANSADLDLVVRKEGRKVKPQEEIFVVMGDGKPKNWRNPQPSQGGLGDLTIPHDPTDESMRAAGFAPLEAVAEDHTHFTLTRSIWSYGIDENGKFTTRRKSPLPAGDVEPDPDEVKILKFSGGLSEWIPEEEVEEGYQRLFDVAGAIVIMISQYTRKCRKTLDIDEIMRDGKTEAEQPKENWLIFSQNIVPRWQPAVLVPRGFRFTELGVTIVSLATRTTDPTFRIEEQLQYSFPATGTTGQMWTAFKPNHGFSVEQFLAWDIATAALELFDPGNPNRNRLYGMVLEVLDDTNFNVLIGGITPTPQAPVQIGLDHPTGTMLYATAGGGYTTTRPTSGDIHVIGQVIDPAYIHFAPVTIYDQADNIRQAVQVTYTDTIPIPYWPTGAPANTQGTPWVRQGEVSIVTETTVINNGFPGSHQFSQSFGIADRGKSLIYRVSLPETETARKVEALIQNSAAGLIASPGLFHNGVGWVGTGIAGESILIHNGWAILSVPVTLSPSLNCNSNTWVSPGRWQAPCFYEPGKDQFVRVETGVKLTDLGLGSAREISDTVIEIAPRVLSLENKGAEQTTKISFIEGKLSNLAPILIVSAITKSSGDAVLVAPDRNGASFSSLSFIFRDNRTIAVGDAKLSYPNRNSFVSIPVAAFTSETLAGWTYNAAMSPDGAVGIPTRKTFWRSFTFDGVIYRCYVQWERVDSEWRFWFQGWHSASWSLTGLADIKAEYVIDTLATDPAYSAFARQKDIDDKLALYTKTTDLPTPDLTGLASKAQLDTVEAKIPDVTGLAKKTDIPAAPDLTVYALKADIPANANSKAVYSHLKPDDTDWQTWYQVEKDYVAWKVTARHWVRIAHQSYMPIAMRVMDMPEPSHDTAEIVSPGVFKATLRGGTTITYRTATTRGINDLDLLQFQAGTYNDISWEILDQNKFKIGNFGTANGGGSVNGFMTGYSQGFSMPFPPGSAFIRYKLTKADSSVVTYDCPIT
jgi:hypothetical protein